MVAKQTTILFFVSLDRSCFDAQMEGLFRHPRAKGWHVQMVSAALSAARIRKSIEFWKPAGIIVECGDTLKVTSSLFMGVPTVMIDIGRRTPPARFNVVGFDSAAAGRLGAEHLLALDLPAYSYIGYWHPMLWDRQRRRAFAETVLKAGRPVSEFFSFLPLPPAERHKRLRAWMKALPHPCGVMACNDTVGEEVLNICSQLGLRVPEDIAVLGVDNDVTLCENTDPPLASIVPGTYRSGLLAAQILARLMSSGVSRDAEPVQMTYPPLGVEMRQSSRRIRCDQSKVASALEMIRRCACDGMRVADVVAAMGMSRRAAEQHFRLATGKSILEEISDVRFGKVFELLRDPNRQIGAIAGTCGFSTEVALRKAFRLRTGMSMSAWRKWKSPN